MDKYEFIGVQLGDKHSYKDFGLVFNSRPVISPPAVKTAYVDVPGMNGSLDLTESLTGDVRYGTRTISLSFKVIGDREKWSGIYSDLLYYLHGQEMRIIFDEDPTYFYKGRVSINEWKSSIFTSDIAVDAVVDPYKYDLYSSTEDWLWDPFNFDTGLIRDYRNLKVDGTLNYTIPGTRMKVVPTFTVKSDDGSGLKVTYERKTYSLPDGTTRIPEIVIKNQTNNQFTFTGNGTVTIEYRGGEL